MSPPAPDELDGEQLPSLEGAWFDVATSEDAVEAQVVAASHQVAQVWEKWGERLGEVSARHLPSDEKPVTMDTSTPPSKGETMARDWTKDPASDPQVNYLNTVLAEAVKLQRALKEKGVDHADELMKTTEEVVAAAHKRLEDGTFTKGNASQAIDFILDMNRKLTKRLRTFGDGSHTIYGRETRTRSRITEDGIYRHPVSGQIWKVQVAKQGSGRLYAKRLEIVKEAVYENVDGGPLDEAVLVEPAKGKFVYAPGALREIDPSWKMTLEQAKEFGALYGMCCVCCATLTAEQSFEEGIGPVCGKRFVSKPPVVDVPLFEPELENVDPCTPGQKCGPSTQCSKHSLEYQRRWGRAANE